jgi:hypothetical protein
MIQVCLMPLAVSRPPFAVIELWRMLLVGYAFVAQLLFRSFRTAPSTQVSP